jgi:hypothetical protein
MVVNPNKRGTLKEPLPKTLAEAAQRARNERVNPRPETVEPYRYVLIDEATYELCATFAKPRLIRAFFETIWQARIASRLTFDPPPF